MSNELLQIDLFRPLIEYIESINVEIKEDPIYLGCEVVAFNESRTIVTIKIRVPNNLSLDKETIDKYFMPGYNINTSHAHQIIEAVFKDVGFAWLVYQEFKSSANTVNS